MPKFNYRAQDQSQQTLEGVLQANTLQEAQQFLASQNLQVLSVKPEKQSFSIEKFLRRFDTVKIVNLNFFVRQLATLLHAGIPMLSCLKSLGDEVHDHVLKEAIVGVTDAVEQGSSFSEGCAKYPKVFNQLFIATVKAGEAIGELDTVLLRLADVFEKDYQTRSKIQSALRYPAFVMVILALAFTVAITFIIPKFESLFASFGSDLPLATKILLGTSHLVINYWFICLVLILGVSFAIYRFYSTKKGRFFLDGKMLNMWLIGPFIRQAIYSRFARLLGLMLKSGVNILPALEMVGDVVGNAVIKDSVLRIRQEVSEGGGIAQQMKRSGRFPNLLVQMVGAGESSGQIDELLTLAADHYDTEVERMTKNVESIIEPLFILVLGLFLAVLVLGVFLPMWNLYGIIGAEA